MLGESAVSRPVGVFELLHKVELVQLMSHVLRSAVLGTLTWTKTESKPSLCTCKLRLKKVLGSHRSWLALDLGAHWPLRLCLEWGLAITNFQIQHPSHCFCKGRRRRRWCLYILCKAYEPCGDVAGRAGVWRCMV
jgi:hypothetical protein